MYEYYLACSLLHSVEPIVVGNSVDGATNLCETRSRPANCNALHHRLLLERGERKKLNEGTSTRSTNTSVVHADKK